jgi:serine protease Do
MGISAAKGALITDVPEGPAKEAGLLAGDVILSFNGSEISDVKDLTRTVADSPIGDAVPVLVLREGSETTVDVTLGRREEAEAVVEAAATPETPAEPQKTEALGLTMVPVDEKVAKDLNLPAGSTGLAVTQVDPASEAAGKGVMPGDVIVEAGQQRVVKLSDLEDRLTEARDAGRKSILLLVRREGDPRFVALGIE